MGSTLTDPTTLTLKVKEPDGNILTYTFGSGDGVIVQESTGKFHADLICTESGTYTYRWQGSGVAAAAEEVQFRVRKSNFPA